MQGFEPKSINLYGHDVTYRMAGDGEPVLLVHGIAGSSTTWKLVMPALSERYTVIAPDLLGHGMSAKPRGDYSLGAYASGVRDLLLALGIDSVSVVGHSLGGGIAMQFAYQFPERCRRLALVASGGLGKEVNPWLRAVALPGAEYVLPLLLTPAPRQWAESGGRQLARLGWRPGAMFSEIWRSYSTLTTGEGRQAFVDTVRSVIDFSGQRVSAMDRIHLAAALPVLIVWGGQDRIIPVAHAHAAHAAIAGSRLAIHPDAGHFVPVEEPSWFLDVVGDFLATTEPAELDAHALAERAIGGR
jgi:pimeloyl-ACP methyl ester carboxylesterase